MLAHILSIPLSLSRAHFSQPFAYINFNILGVLGFRFAQVDGHQKMGIACSRNRNLENGGLFFWIVGFIFAPYYCFGDLWMRRQRICISDGKHYSLVSFIFFFTIAAHIPRCLGYLSGGVPCFNFPFPPFFFPGTSLCVFPQTDSQSFFPHSHVMNNGQVRIECARRL